jgi:hypothetical protein
MSSTRVFLVEAYAAASSEVDSLSAAAGRVGGGSVGARAIRHIRSILVPEDETCLHLYEAESAESLADAIKVAAMRAERIVEVRS